MGEIIIIALILLFSLYCELIWLCPYGYLVIGFVIIVCIIYIFRLSNLSIQFPIFQFFFSFVISTYIVYAVLLLAAPLKVCNAQITCQDK